MATESGNPLEANRRLFFLCRRRPAHRRSTMRRSDPAIRAKFKKTGFSESGKISAEARRLVGELPCLARIDPSFTYLAGHFR